MDVSTSPATLRWIRNEATLLRRNPMSMLPIESNTGRDQKCEIERHAEAIATPVIAAQSSRKTCTAVGSAPFFKYSKNETPARVADFEMWRYA
jgi:hypothetical protein